MRKTIFILALATAGLAVGCSNDNGSTNGGHSSASQDSGSSTSLSINTDKGAMSFKNADSGNSTSLSINSGGKK